MNDIKAALLYLDSFDEHNMFDFEHKNKFYFLSEVLRSEMHRRTMECNLNKHEDANLVVIHLTIKITVMINIKNLVCYKKNKKLYDGVLQFVNDSDSECESIEHDDCNVLSEDSDTCEIIGFRNM